MPSCGGLLKVDEWAERAAETIENSASITAVQILEVRIPSVNKRVARGRGIALARAERISIWTTTSVSRRPISPKSVRRNDGLSKGLVVGLAPDFGEVGPQLAKAGAFRDATHQNQFD
jgi:hypothetical protein